MHDIREGFAVFAHPAANRTGALDRIKPAGFAQDRRRQARVHPVHSLQKAPGRRFADGQVGIVLGLAAAQSRQGDACHQAHGNQIEENIKLLRLQRVLLMETGSQGSCCADRIFHVENGIRAGDGDFGNQNGMDRIAKVDDA